MNKLTLAVILSIVTVSSMLLLGATTRPAATQPTTKKQATQAKGLARHPGADGMHEPA